MSRLVLILTLIAALRPAQGALVSALAFSPDGRTLASSGYERVDLRSPDDATLCGSVLTPFPRVTSLAFIGNDFLAAGGGKPGESGAVAVLALATKTVSRTIDGYDDLVTSLSVSRNGEWLAAGSANHSATIYSLRTSAAVTLSGHSGPVLSVAFSPDGTSVVTASADRSIKVWDLQGKLIRSFNHHTEAVHALAFRPANDSAPIECASGSDDGSVRIWQPAIGRMVRIIRGHAGPIFALVYSPDGKALLSAGKEGIIRTLDVDSDEILGQQKASADVIYSLAINPAGSKAAIGQWSGEVKIWERPQSE